MNATPSSSPREASTTGRGGPSSGRHHQIDATERIPPAGERALVLHGGGSAGNAWEIGVIAGLLEGGLDVTEADLIVGTSAGATAAAQITSADPVDLLAAVLAAPSPGPPRRPQPEERHSTAQPVAAQLERTGRIIASASDAADMRRRMGAAALALDAESDGSRSAQWRATVAARLASPHWPERTVLITAVDARTGRPVTFDRSSGIDLVDAVAASTSSGLPYWIGDDRYIDGGYRRNENADLAAGYKRVLVLSPFGGKVPAPTGMGHAARGTDRRATRTRQQRRGDLSRPQLRHRVR